MKTLRNLLLGAVMAGALAAPAASETINLDVDATIATAIAANQTAGISFGLFNPGTVDSTFGMLPSSGGTVTTISGDYVSLTNGEVGVVDITGTAGAQVQFGGGGNAQSAGGELAWLGLECRISGPTIVDEPCTTAVETIDGSGQLQVLIGGSVRWIGVHPVAPGNYTISVPLDINYL